MLNGVTPINAHLYQKCALALARAAGWRAFADKCGTVRGPTKAPLLEKGFRQQATGNRQQATGNRQQATGNRQQATGNRQQATYYTYVSSSKVNYLAVSHLHTNSFSQTTHPVFGELIPYISSLRS